MLKASDKLYLSGKITTFDISRLVLPDLSQAKLTVNMDELEYADSNVFWFIRHWARENNISLEYEGVPTRLKDLVEYLPLTDEPEVKSTPVFKWFNYHLIGSAVRMCKIAFLHKNNFNPAQRRLVWSNFMANISEIGLKSIPVFAVTNFFLGIVIMFQGSYQMSQFAAELYAVDFLGLSIFRELGPILTGILLASRSGSAITAQLGTMKNNEEIAAIEVMGLSPIKLLVLPKLMALVCLGPFLTLFSCLIAILGGLLIFIFYLDYSAQLFFNILHYCLTSQSFWMFAWKGPLFAFLIGVIACTQGLAVKHGSIDLSQKTTASVVASLITVLLVEGILSFITT